MRTIDELRALIPLLECPQGCSACCGHVPWSRVEWEMLPEKFRRQHTIHTPKCPFVDRKNGRCSVWEYRPLTCRMFGVSELFLCPMGVKPKEFLSLSDTELISREYFSNYF